MSSNGHYVEVGAVVVGAFVLDDRSGFPTHDHQSHQLAWASSGALVMGAAGRTWVLPRSRALWIPAQIPHDVVAGGRTRMVSLYFEPEACPISFDEPTVVGTGGLLGHLMDHLTGSLAPDARARAEAVVFDLIAPVPAAELDLPEPADDRVRRIAEALRNDPADPKTLVEWGRIVGASGRTLTRSIQRDTGLTFASWRTQIRIGIALGHLARGMPVTRVAAEVGYATPSAFVAAFRRTVGATPSRYFTAAPS